MDATTTTSVQQTVFLLDGSQCLTIQISPIFTKTNELRLGDRTIDRGNWRRALVNHSNQWISPSDEGRAADCKTDSRFQENRQNKNRLYHRPIQRNQRRQQNQKMHFNNREAPASTSKKECKEKTKPQQFVSAET